MSALSALGSRPLPPPVLPAPAQLAAGNGVGTARTGHPIVDPVTLSDSGIDLSRRALAERADRLGSATVDAAQQLVGSVAASLFGGDGKGLTLSLDSASIATDSTLSAQLQASTGADGATSSSAAFSLSESSHFIGKGHITTADGRSFAFEVEVQYDSTISSSASQFSAPASAGQPNAPASASAAGASAAPADANAAPPVRQLGDIAYPGSLSDLFKLLGRTLQAPADNGQGSGPPQGNLTLRLLKLLDASTLNDAGKLLDPAQSKSDAQAKALANAYGSTPADSTAAPAALAASAAASPAGGTASTSA